METAATTESGSADLARQRLLVRALRRRLHLIVAVTALAASAGLFLASSRATTWSATTVIELLDDTVGASQHTVSPEEFEAERQTLESNQLSAALIAALGARGESLGAVSARADEDSTILTITTTADQPAAAVLAAETVVDVFTEQRITNQIEFFAAEAAELQTRIAEQEVMIAELKVDLDTQEDVNLSSALETRLFQSVDRSQQLQRVLRELESEITLADGRIAVIDRPIAASASRRSQLLTALQAGLLGALLAAGAVLVTASRSNRIEIVDQLEELYPELPAIAAVPVFRKQFRQQTNSIVVGRADAMREAEAFRYIRTAVELTSPMGRCFTVAVTSTVPGEGKTVSSTNLAVSLAAAGGRTLFIDGDLLSPSIPELSGRPKATNTLPDLLSGVPIDELTTTIGTDARSLDLLIRDRSGSEATSPGARIELVSSDISDALAELDSDYDAVIIDCPPALLVADAISLAAATDGVIVVVRLGSTKRGELIRAVDASSQGGATILGFVATHAADDGSRYGRYNCEQAASSSSGAVTNGHSTTQGRTAKLTPGGNR